MSLELRNMDDQSEEPLMRNGDDRGHHRLPGGGEAAEELGAAAGPGRFVWMLTLSAGISGLLFGYDTGVISSTLVSIGSDLSSRQLTTFDKSLITASTSLCALIISPVSGTLADRFGRKSILLLSDILFAIGAALQAFSTVVWLMVIGRGIIGFAVGAASFITPLYIAELAPTRFRGRLVTLNVLAVTSGQVVAYLIGWGFASWGGQGGWRWMVGIGAVPAVVQALLLVGMPESPRWLVMVGRGEQAASVLRKVFGKNGERTVSAVLRSIEVEVQEEEEAKRGRLRALPTRKRTGVLGDTWTELFGVPGHRRALIIACLLQGLQQLCGFNSLMYFSATIFSMLRFSTPTLTSLSVAITNMAFTVIALLVIDTVGRRRILLLSIPVMILALVACAIAFDFVDISPDTNATAQAATSRTFPILVLLSIIFYVAAYAIGLGNVPWQQSELFPLSVRSLGSSLSTATNWGSNFIMGITFLPSLDWLSPTWTFAIYAGVCAGGWFAVWRIYPETSGLSLEETGDLLRDGWGVDKGRKVTETPFLES